MATWTARIAVAAVAALWSAVPVARCPGAATAEGGSITRLARSDPDAVAAVAPSLDGQFVAAATATGVRLLPATGGAATRFLPAEAPAVSVQFSADGSRLLASYSDGTARLWDPATATMIRRLLPHPRGARTTALSPDGRLVAGGGDDGTIHLIDAETGNSLRRLVPVPEPVPGVRAAVPAKVQAVAFSPDGEILVSGHGPFDPFVRVWDVGEGRQVARLRGDGEGVRSVVFSHDGGTLATSADAGQVFTLWETTTWRVRRKLSAGGGASEFPRAFSADGRSLWSMTPDELWRWDLRTGRRVQRFTGEHRALSCAAAFASDARIVTGGEEGATVVWNVATNTVSDPRPAEDSAEIRLEGPWGALAGEDASAAYDAMWALAAVPDKSVPYLRNRLPQQQPVDAALVEQLITQLDAEQFTARENATRKLAQLGDAIEPLLRRRLSATRSPEAGQRIEVLLDSLRPSLADGDLLRDYRALEVLGWIGTADARAALQEVAGGSSGTRLRARAAAAIRRLDHLAQSAPRPSAGR